MKYSIKYLKENKSTLDWNELVKTEKIDIFHIILFRKYLNWDLVFEHQTLDRDLILSLIHI